MRSQTNEQALEAAIERALTGQCQEDAKAGLVAESPADYVGSNGFKRGIPSDFNAQYALDEKWFWQFLESTQQATLTQLQKHSPNDWQRRILERFDRLAKKNGVLHLLKKGLSLDDVHFHLMYPAPLASSSDQVKQHFEANIFSVTRQVRYSLANPLQEIDMVLFVNGIPLVTLELKNAWTGQTARYHGQKQYRSDRDTNQPLLQFARCLVHMAVDTDEVYMTTKLSGQSTFFLPFNKGHNQGQGNPPNPNGHKTDYLWKEVFTKDSLANLIQHFIRLDGSSKDPLNKRNLFFPRYHQMDVVRRLIKDVSTQGVGQTYLIQHSAGSGKSNSITWAAYQLIEAHPEREDVPGAKGLEEPLFDSVIVVTDRRILDKQLKDNIKDFSEVKNIVAHANKSADLKSALEGGKKIIITTIQKFPFIIDGLSDLSDKRFAVIIDEAHSSQSGTAHSKMNEAMGADEELDAQDKILQAMRSRKMRDNASYLAFTATPKNTTLEKFGHQQPDSSFVPFHLYSMKQAIEEGFILDVLANYTTYRSYYEIQKSIAENPKFDTAKAQKKLRAYVERSQQTIDTKAEIMLDHFVTHVVNTKKLKGKAKAMIVTQSIEMAIRYFKAVQRLLDQQGNPFKAIIAFSGEKKVDGIDYTESDMNGFSDNDTKDKFDTDEYRLLVVANKYLTGFDQPKLTAMYIDKKLQGVLAVQALSRLNRAAPKLGKKTEDLFVLDFFNSTDDIKKSFDPFYTATSLSEPTDINVLNDLKDALDDVGVYEGYEVEKFAQGYFDGVDGQALSAMIDVAVARFESELVLENDEQADFKIKAKQFVKIYGQMASIMPYENMQWEKLFWFLKFLIPKLKVADPEADQLDALLESVDLSSYGLERVRLNQSIGLDATETQLDPQNPNPRGAHGEKQEDPLDEIIRDFNERWFQDWSATPEEQRVKFINIADSIKAHPDFETKYKNETDPHHRDLVFEKMLKEVMLKRRKEELELYKLFAGDAAFKAAWTSTMQHRVAI
ncbi:type I restriction endonuclease subunit R [Thiomicrospira sp. ALE5]|uniref:type I restriction endonuclease subunit R n=1 Tax=Thiomicrospira sp. ALE5 TaxID=748650 RepID=UPI0008F1A2B2|nr:type I restriction endonuclease subunit R [Thiomicrospira sp. ALE5]SFR52572.1 type I restriction enzyme, R subunit [Thiomicrospira sp. ALE5]